MNKVHKHIVYIGLKIKEARVSKNISMYKLGLLIGIDGSNMRKIEQGQNITIATLLKILTVLKIKPKDFFSGIDIDLIEDNIDELSKRRK